MKNTSVIKALCYVCILAGLACKLLIPDPLLSSILGIGLMAIAVVILGIMITKSRRG